MPSISFKLIALLVLLLTFRKKENGKAKLKHQVQNRNVLNNKGTVESELLSCLSIYFQIAQFDK